MLHPAQRSGRLLSVTHPAPTHPERLFAAGTHLSGIFFPLLGPLVSLVVLGRSSRFVAFHAWKALLELVFLKVFLVVLGLGSFGFTLYRLSQDGLEGFDWRGMLLRMAVSWVLLALLEVWNTVTSVRQAWQAYQGHLGGRSLADRRARQYARLEA
jgi:uncharacterized membrane protein